MKHHKAKYNILLTKIIKISNKMNIKIIKIPFLKKDNPFKIKSTHRQHFHLMKR
jgi:hypothetical protein